MNLKSWADYERERRAVQKYSPRFSRAELCRRAGISDTTMMKGLKGETAPRRHTGGPVGRAIEQEKERLTNDQRDAIELALAGERMAIEAGIVGGEQ